MSKIIWALINLPDLSIVNLLSVFVLVQRILNKYLIYPTRRSFLGEVETPYSAIKAVSEENVNTMDK